MGLPSRTTPRPQLVPNTSVPLLLGTESCTQITPFLQSLCWLPVCSWVQFKILITTRKALCGLGCTYLKDCLSQYAALQQLMLIWAKHAEGCHSTNRYDQQLSVPEHFLLGLPLCEMACLRKPGKLTDFYNSTQCIKWDNPRRHFYKGNTAVVKYNCSGGKLSTKVPLRSQGPDRLVVDFIHLGRV